VIEHPDEVARYICRAVCTLSDNQLLMVLLWEALATRQVKLLAASMRTRFAIPANCAWVNYVRCHDDIGWTFSDEDAARLGMDAYGHRTFLNRFYTGRFEGSFARGLPFQENPRTGDCRISGTCASLAGLEKAILENNPSEVELAIRRVLLIHGIILTIGGIPLLYLGDELGTLNDYSFRMDSGKARDSRWVHRSPAQPERYMRRNDSTTVEGQIYEGLQLLICMRKEHPAFAGHKTQFIETENESVFAYLCEGGGERIIVLANFSEQPCSLSTNLLRIYGLSYRYKDLLTEKRVSGAEIHFAPYQVAYLKEDE